MESVFYGFENENIMNIEFMCGLLANAYGHIEPSLEQQKIIRDRIDEINEELKNVC